MHGFDGMRKRLAVGAAAMLAAPAITGLGVPQAVAQTRPPPPPPPSFPAPPKDEPKEQQKAPAPQQPAPAPAPAPAGQTSSSATTPEQGGDRQKSRPNRRAKRGSRKQRVKPRPLPSPSFAPITAQPVVQEVSDGAPGWMIAGLAASVGLNLLMAGWILGRRPGGHTRRSH